VFVPRHCGHRFKNITGQAAKTLFLFTPAGPEEAQERNRDQPGEEMPCV
jgi:hypothetical protein